MARTLRVRIPGPVPFSLSPGRPSSRVREPASRPAACRQTVMTGTGSRSGPRRSAAVS